MDKGLLTTEEYKEAVYYAELGSPTKGKRVIDELVARIDDYYKKPAEGLELTEVIKDEIKESIRLALHNFEDDVAIKTIEETCFDDIWYEFQKQVIYKDAECEQKISEAVEEDRERIIALLSFTVELKENTVVVDRHDWDNLWQSLKVGS